MPKLDADKHESSNNALGSLMSGYEDSSSDDESGTKAFDKAQSGHFDAKQHQSTPAPSTLHGETSNEGHISDKKQENITERIATDAPQRVNKIEIEAHKPSKGHAETSIKRGKEGKAAEISNEVWDEFNSLLDDDEAKTANDTAIEPAKPEASAEPLIAEAPPTNAAEKKPKKKKKKGSVKNMYDNEGLNNVEQASYEARLARLMLLKSKKMQHRNDETANAPPSTDEFYDPGLAFQEKSIENDASAKIDGTANVPTISLAKILRDRRDQARQLSFRGNDVIDSKSDPANNNSDGCWF